MLRALDTRRVMLIPDQEEASTSGRAASGDAYSEMDGYTSVESLDESWIHNAETLRFASAKGVFLGQIPLHSPKAE
jgi:hypothetical protein